jgi:pullulanase
MTTKSTLNYLFLAGLLYSCADRITETGPYNDEPAPLDADLWVNYTRDATVFRIWSPAAEEIKLHLYREGNGDEPIKSLRMRKEKKGIWELRIEGDLDGTYYTYQVKTGGELLAETPGIYAKAVGVNGKRAMVLDMDRTDPEGWDRDRGPVLHKPNDAVIYELHVRDITIDPSSGAVNRGKFTGLAEAGTQGPGGVATGLAHLKELGITHVHVLPSFDFLSVDESRPDSAQYNWGYDPQNYNVPEGSYSTDPWRAEVRIREFKEMVKAFHDAGIGVILDVVYNHTGTYHGSNFNLEVPGYYYRHREDGSLSDASACGNETASERPMMRKFMLESVAYWAREYHLDGFRFDLMAIHDIETMNEIARTLKELNPSILVYGEGWASGDSPYPPEKRAFKAHMEQLPQIAAFSDEIRDGLKGSVFEDESRGFVSGERGTEESVKMGIVGCIDHPQIDFSEVNYVKTPWASEPWQSVLYVSCHDNHTLFDKLSISLPDASLKELIAMDRLANAVVLTSQGMPFLHSGSEMLRTKHGNHNSFNAPDSINRIDWNRKTKYAGTVEYYENLIRLRKQHPAFRMSGAEEVREHLSFEVCEDGFISYRISGHANGDEWENILVAFNARPEPARMKIDGAWQIAVKGDDFNPGEVVRGTLVAPPLSMTVAYQK